MNANIFYSRKFALIIIVSPQCPEGERWAYPSGLDLLDAILKARLFEAKPLGNV
ncbi:hypothetical protein L0337_00270 [candidate division KSB1 bacterium]|nr:hypothetical protein [candidate division KSB1 bacterium]